MITTESHKREWPRELPSTTPHGRRAARCRARKNCLGPKGKAK